MKSLQQQVYEDPDCNLCEAELSNNPPPGASSGICEILASNIFRGLKTPLFEIRPALKWSLIKYMSWALLDSNKSLELKIDLSEL